MANMNEATNYGGLIPGHIAAYEAFFSQGNARTYAEPAETAYRDTKSDAPFNTYSKAQVLSGPAAEYMKMMAFGFGAALGNAYANKMQGYGAQMPGTGCTCGNCPVHSGKAGGLEYMVDMGGKTPNSYRSPNRGSTTRTNTTKPHGTTTQDRAYRA